MEQSSDQRSISFCSDREVWNVCGYHMPKLEVVYFSQIVILYIVIIICLINLSVQHAEVELWCSLLSASIGYLLPNPSLKKEKIILQKCNI
jgi:hypothetical protein